MNRLEYRQRLAELLQQEQSGTRRLLTELERQQQSLASAQPELIEASALASAQHIQTLEALEKQRNALAARLGYSGDNDGMAQLIRWCDYDGTLAQQWRRLLETARRCRDCNQVNGAVVDINRRRVRQALGILRGQLSEAELYGRSGQTAADTLSRPLAKA
jgi:flagellar biosynthesis/type III secretory pathway chaperone